MEPWTGRPRALLMEAWRLKTELKRVSGTEVSNYGEQDPDQDPDPHQSEKSNPDPDPRLSEK
jgi:hypothetical protein